MLIIKGKNAYTVTESATKWTVKTASGKLELVFDVSKEICATVDALQEYVLKTKMF
jgi:hypothetical protein